MVGEAVRPLEWWDSTGGCAARHVPASFAKWLQNIWHRAQNTRTLFAFPMEIDQTSIVLVDGRISPYCHT